MIGDELNERKERIVDRIDRTRAQPEVLRELHRCYGVGGNDA
jgi:hypothetical protein